MDISSGSFVLCAHALRTWRGRAAFLHFSKIQAVDDLGRQDAAPLIERAYAPTITLQDLQVSVRPEKEGNIKLQKTA